MSVTPNIAAEPPARRFVSVAAFSGAVIAGALLTASAILWLRFGPAVFLDMLAAGLAACF
jgi:hypothetical protein